MCRNTKANRAFRLPVSLAVVLLAVSVLASSACAQGLDGFNLRQASEYLKLLPPIIKSVTRVPENPRVGDTVTVTASVYRLRSGGEDDESITSVTLRYTVDGDNWIEVPMTKSEDEDWLWTCEIPPMDVCGEVDYHITAKDSAGNIATEIPAWLAMPGWGKQAPGAQPASPHDFLTLIYDHVNSEKSAIPPELRMTEIPGYLDVQSVWFGYDDDNLYFRFRFGSAVDAGTVQPINLNAYFMALINGSLESVIGEALTAGMLNGQGGARKPNMPDLAKRFWVWYYAPPLDIIPPMGGEKPPGIGLIHFDGKNIGKPVFETKGFRSSVHGDFMDVSLSRKFIGQPVGDSITFVISDLKVSGMDYRSIKQQIGDVSYTTTVMMYDHGYEVCAEGE